MKRKTKQKSRETTKSAKLITQCLKLQQLLSETPEGLTLDELGEQLVVHPRTVNRYLAAMRDSGINLIEYTVPDTHGMKRWMMPGKQIRTATFNSDEVASLYLACRFLQPLSETFLGQSAEEALKRIRRQLVPNDEIKIDKILKLFYIENGGWIDYHDKIDMIEALMIACEDCCEVRVEYHSSLAAKPETYNFRPYELIYRGGKLLVIP